MSCLSLQFRRALNVQKKWCLNCRELMGFWKNPNRRIQGESDHAASLLNLCCSYVYQEALIMSLCKCNCKTHFWGHGNLKAFASQNKFNSFRQQSSKFLLWSNFLSLWRKRLEDCSFIGSIVLLYIRKKTIGSFSDSQIQFLGFCWNNSFDVNKTPNPFLY